MLSETEKKLCLFFVIFLEIKKKQNTEVIFLGATLRQRGVKPPLEKLCDKVSLCYALEGLLTPGFALCPKPRSSTHFPFLMLFIILRVCKSWYSLKRHVLVDLHDVLILLHGASHEPLLYVHIIIVIKILLSCKTIGKEWNIFSRSFVQRFYAAFSL